jgi:hypothetical protein
VFANALHAFGQLDFGQCDIAGPPMGRPGERSLAHRGGTNLVIFTAQLDAHDLMEVYREDICQRTRIPGSEWPSRAVDAPEAYFRSMLIA